MMTNKQIQALMEAKLQIGKVTLELYDEDNQEARRLCRYIWCATGLLDEIIDDELKKIKNGEQSL